VRDPLLRGFVLRESRGHTCRTVGRERASRREACYIGRRRARKAKGRLRAVFCHCLSCFCCILFTSCACILARSLRTCFAVMCSLSFTHSDQYCHNPLPTSARARQKQVDLDLPREQRFSCWKTPGETAASTTSPTPMDLPKHRLSNGNKYHTFKTSQGHDPVLTKHRLGDCRCAYWQPPLGGSQLAPAY